MKVSHFKLKARFNKLTDFNNKIVKLHQLFSSYFINTIEILNVLFLILNNSELFNTEIINNNNIYITNTINLNSLNIIENSLTIISSDSLRKTFMEKIMM